LQIATFAAMGYVLGRNHTPLDETTEHLPRRPTHDAKD
jgi:hypothetical protein